MKILALDSSSYTASIAFLECNSSGENNVIFRYHCQQERTNSSIFFEGLQLALQQHGRPDRLVIGLGPGSYNGLRTSIAAAQGIASACHLPIIGLPSILGLEAAECWVIGDARGGQYWLARIFHHQLVEEPFLLAPANLENHLKRYPHFPVISSQEFSHLPSSIKVTIQTPDVAILALLGKNMTPSTSLAGLEPIYLKAPHITSSHRS
jgi:tRNA threonylcarbamoyl adenosine modification protein YeaZ